MQAELNCKLELDDATIGPGQFQNRLWPFSEELLNRLSNALSPQIIVDQEDSSPVHFGIEKFQRIMSGLVQVHVEMHKGEALVSDRGSGCREKTLIDMDVRKINKI